MLFLKIIRRAMYFILSFVKKQTGKCGMTKYCDSCGIKTDQIVTTFYNGEPKEKWVWGELRFESELLEKHFCKKCDKRIYEKEDKDNAR